MSYEQILYEVTDPVATITLNRPEALNAWTPQMGAELADAAGRADRDRAVVGIVLTGAGRGFCAGADMTMLSGIGGDDGASGASRRRRCAIPSSPATRRRRTSCGAPTPTSCRSTSR